MDEDFTIKGKLYTEAELQARLALLLREGVGECERHAKFCKDEREKGGDADHLSAREAEANYLAKRILSLHPDLDKALAEHDAALRAGVIAALDLAAKERGSQNVYAFADEYLKAGWICL